jgi:putative serine/threonine protein kinase
MSAICLNLGISQPALVGFTELRVPIKFMISVSYCTKEGEEMETPLTVLTENLWEEPYASILCYPKPSEAEVQKRLLELRQHGVEAMEFAGKASAFNVPVLGKGFVGIVVAAHLDGQRVALKIRRVDADRLALQDEAQMLAKANTVQVGPRLIGVSKNFLLMQLIDGAVIPEWLNVHKEQAYVRGVLNDVLEQCWRLDTAGLDHGELSRAPKHIIVDKQHKPWIVDFETASDNRKPANITSVCQYLFIGGGAVAGAVAEALGERSRERIIEALRRYKKARTRENFDRVKQICLG